MAYSLIEFGMDPVDDADLQLIFMNDDEPHTFDEKARWVRMRRIVTGGEHYSYWNGRETAEEFYVRGMEDFANRSDAARAAWEEEFPMPTEPSGGADHLTWKEEYLNPRLENTFRAWFSKLVHRMRHDLTTSADRRLLSDVEAEVAPQLKKLVQDFKGRKDFVLRKDAQRERAESNERYAPPTRSRPRRWGEVPAEPEVTYRRRSP